jgi:hypothetical protein
VLGNAAPLLGLVDASLAARQMARQAVKAILAEERGETPPEEYDYLPYFYSRLFNFSWRFYGVNEGRVAHFGTFEYGLASARPSTRCPFLTGLVPDGAGKERCSGPFGSITARSVVGRRRWLPDTTAPACWPHGLVGLPFVAQVVGTFLETGSEQQHARLQELARTRPSVLDEEALTALLRSTLGEEGLPVDFAAS